MKQGEIWLVSLEPTIGAEIKKTRPALIINDNTIGKLPLKIIVPLTDWKDHYSAVSWMIKIVPNNDNGLSKSSAADCFQVRSVSEKRLIKCLGQVTADEISRVQDGLAVVIGL
ncbi:MAG: type II toxin-antitoxin system PemK/MazF family toxin [Candidatus Margulisbacteria bacterium]|jgi:mRNA interferase MazF|nr:type II toxin-antitoxin system PemK/MazF family toxin [Candidatus Margulisiibacteriota bacterium]